MSNIYGKRQKCRSFVKFKYPTLRFGNVSIFALSSGFLNFRMVSNFYIRFKKIFKFFKSITKFWYNLYCSYIITKKALNVRMGKGKGSRKGRVCYVKSSAPIIEMTYCRLGLLLYLYKYIRVRCSFKIFYMQNRFKLISTRNSIIRNSLINKKKKHIKVKKKRFIKDRINNVIDTYKSTKRLIKAGFFSRLIKRYFIKYSFRKLRRKLRYSRILKNYTSYTKRFRYFKFFLRRGLSYKGGYFFFIEDYEYNYIFILKNRCKASFFRKFKNSRVMGFRGEYRQDFQKRLYLEYWLDVLYKKKLKMPTILFKLWGIKPSKINFFKNNNKLHLLAHDILKHSKYINSVNLPTLKEKYKLKVRFKKFKRSRVIQW